MHGHAIYNLQERKALDVTSLHLPNDKVVSVDNILALLVYTKISDKQV